MSKALVEEAIYGWLSTATGLWTQLMDQDAPQEAVDYCAYKATLRQGPTLPTQARRLVEGAPPGEELEVTHAERAAYTVLVQAYTASTTGPTAAMEVLARARAALVLESVRARLKAEAGVAVLTRGPVREINALAGPRWQGRAAMEVVVNVVESVVERTTYIETTDVTVVHGG